MRASRQRGDRLRASVCLVFSVFLAFTVVLLNTQDVNARDENAQGTDVRPELQQSDMVNRSEVTRQHDDPAETVDAEVSGYELAWQEIETHGKVVLHIGGPEISIRKEFGPGEEPFLNNGGIQFSMENTAPAKRWDFTNNTIGDFNISLVGTGGPELRLTGAGNLFIRGTLTGSSDRDKKENYQEVDCNEVLQKVADLPVTTWNYIDDDDSVRHMGPVAQDFRAAFGLGHNDTTITTTDKAGVALVAIKALKNKLDEKDATITELQTELDEIHDRMARLEAAVNMLTEQ